jgi:small subunit ribosomal protein S17
LRGHELVDVVIPEEEKNEQVEEEAPEQPEPSEDEQPEAAAETAAGEEAPEEAPQAAEEPAAEEAEEPAAEEAAEEPAAAEAPAEPGEDLPWKERRRLQRSRRPREPKPERGPEERQVERAEARRAKAVMRRRYRQARRAKRGEPGTGTPPAERRPNPRKVRLGVVVSNKADKTITVRVDTARRHPSYEKIVRRSRTLHAHDERNQAGEGDIVRVVETRPISRSKRWRLLDVVEKAR